MISSPLIARFLTGETGVAADYARIQSSSGP